MDFSKRVLSQEIFVLLTHFCQLIGDFNENWYLVPLLGTLDSIATRIVVLAVLLSEVSALLSWLLVPVGT